MSKMERQTQEPFFFFFFSERRFCNFDIKSNSGFLLHSRASEKVTQSWVSAAILALWGWGGYGVGWKRSVGGGLLKLIWGLRLQEAKIFLTVKREREKIIKYWNKTSPPPLLLPSIPVIFILVQRKKWIKLTGRRRQPVFRERLPNRSIFSEEICSSWRPIQIQFN